MHAAALGGNVDIVKLLLSHGVLLHTTTVVNNPHNTACIPCINMEHCLFSGCCHSHVYMDWLTIYSTFVVLYHTVNVLQQIVSSGAPELAQSCGGPIN